MHAQVGNSIVKLIESPHCLTSLIDRIIVPIQYAGRILTVTVGL